MTKTKASSTHFSNKQSLTQECAEVHAINLIGGQWSLAICCYLINGKMRYGEIRKCLPHITERVLTLQLRKLEENNIVVRTVFAEIPPRVEYELTTLGYELAPLIKALGDWGLKHRRYHQGTKTL